MSPRSTSSSRLSIQVARILSLWSRISRTIFPVFITILDTSKSWMLSVTSSLIWHSCVWLGMLGTGRRYGRWKTSCSITWKAQVCRLHWLPSVLSLSCFSGDSLFESVILLNPWYSLCYCVMLCWYCDRWHHSSYSFLFVNVRTRPVQLITWLSACSNR